MHSDRSGPVAPSNVPGGEGRQQGEGEGGEQGTGGGGDQVGGCGARPAVGLFGWSGGLMRSLSRTAKWEYGVRGATMWIQDKAQKHQRRPAVGNALPRRLPPAS